MGNEKEDEEDKIDKEEKEKTSNKKETLTDKVKDNPWIISTFVLGIVFLALMLGNLTGFTGSITGNVVSGSEAGDIVKYYFQNYEGIKVTVDSVKKTSGVYFVKISSEEGKTGQITLSLDGKYFGILSPLNIEEEISETTSQDIPKSDVPKVELFVMTYCPYGMKAQEILFPVMDLFKNKVDFRVRFVYYAMHGKKELDENFVQYCIQEKEPSKYSDYLNCFLESENSDSCLITAGISKSIIDSCISEKDEEFKIYERYEDTSTWLSGRYPLFDIEKDIGDSYDVGGSEALIINGATASMSDYRWSSENLKNLICEAFNDKPEECFVILDSGSESSVEGSCG